MLGQTATRTIIEHPQTVSAESLRISDAYDLALVLPEKVKAAARTAYVYKLFFVFENFLRDFVLDVLATKDAASAGAKENWWDKVPKDVQLEVKELAEKEETKAWMALGARDKITLTTYPQLLKIIDECWKLGFEELVRDKSLIQEARLIAHLRNTVCHMAEVSEEEVERVRQVIRDWFRVVSP
jgi:hypothetical protein